MRVRVLCHVVLRQISRTSALKTSDRHADGIAKDGVCGDRLVRDCQVAVIPEALVIAADHELVAPARDNFLVFCTRRRGEGDRPQDVPLVKRSLAYGRLAGC
jgi:hypothetical protein